MDLDNFFFLNCEKLRIRIRSDIQNPAKNELINIDYNIDYNGNLGICKKNSGRTTKRGVKAGPLRKNNLFEARKKDELEEEGGGCLSGGIFCGYFYIMKGKKLG